MSKVIIVKGCVSCPYSCHTDDFDNYNGFKCTEIHSNVGWSEEEFVNMDDDFVDTKCLLPDYKKGGEKMTNKEKVKEMFPFYQDMDDVEIVQTTFKRAGAIEMAEWKDDVVKGFLFELSMLLTEPKTDIERAICIALPMSGLNAIDEVGDFLREKFWEYEHKGTILKNE